MTPGPIRYSRMPVVHLAADEMGLMHPDAAAFLDAILAAPFDRAPRLVYADWLQENGREPEADRLRRLAAGPSYVVRPCGVLGFGGLNFHERHGLPFRAFGTLRSFLAHADRLFRTWPITDVVLDDCRPDRHDPEHPGGFFGPGEVADGEWLWERWHRDDGGDSPPADNIPRPIFRFLGGRLVGRDWYRAFPTRRAALVALRRAAARYGRDLAGLPEITWPEGGKP